MLHFTLRNRLQLEPEPWILLRDEARSLSGSRPSSNWNLANLAQAANDLIAGYVDSSQMIGCLSHFPIWIQAGELDAGLESSCQARCKSSCKLPPAWWFFIIQLFPCSAIPPFHYSAERGGIQCGSSPLFFHYSTIPLYRFSTIPLLLYSVCLLFQYSIILLSRGDSGRRQPLYMVKLPAAASDANPVSNSQARCWLVGKIQLEFYRKSDFSIPKDPQNIPTIPKTSPKSLQNISNTSPKDPKIDHTHTK